MSLLAHSLCRWSSTLSNVHRIASIDNLQPVANYIRRLDKNALVCWDVDKTLIVPSLKLATDVHYSFVREQIKIILQEKHIEATTEKVDQLQSLIYLANKSRLITQQSVQLNHELNQREIRNIAVTALPRGSFGKIEDIVEWRLTDLHQLGYVFNTGFSSTDCFQFKNVAYRYNMAFRKGALFSSYLSKGEAIRHLLSRLQLTPSEAVLVDDKDEHLQSFSRVMEELNIPSQAFHYQEVAHYGEDLDPKTVKAQLDYLVEREEWGAHLY